MKREKMLRMLMCLVLAGALMLTPVPALAAGSGEPPAQRETAGIRTPETGEDIVFPSSEDGEKPELPEDLEWAVIIYMCASDLETNGGDASYALAEILRMDLPEGLAIIALTGGANKWDPLGTGESQPGYVTPSADENAVYWIQKGTAQYGANRMVKLGAIQATDDTILNMGDADTAVELLGLVDEKFPAVFKAEHVMLVFMDHGAAWAGAAVDEACQDILDHAELRKAVAAAKELHGDKNIDIVGFDACLMSCLEIAWQFRDLADYLVGSEEVGFTPCWLYDFLDTKWDWSAWGENGSASGVGALELAKSVVDTYIHAKEEGNSSYLPRTLAVTDLRRIEALRDAFAAFSNEVLGQIADELLHGTTPEEQLATFIRVARAAEATQAMRTARGMIDMYDFLDRLNQIDTLEGEANEVIAALGVPPSVEDSYIGETTGNDPAVLYRGTCPQFDRSGGLSLYYPIASCTYPLSYLEEIYDDMDLMDSYGALLKVLGADTDREVIAFGGELETVPSEDGRFTVHVTEDADTIKKTEFVTTYTDFAEGVTYLLGTDLVTEDWTGGTLSKAPYETWISVDEQPVTVLLDLDGDMNLDGTGINLYTVPLQIELLNGNWLDGELSIIYEPESNSRQFQGLKYTVPYVDDQGVTQSISGSVPLAAVKAAYPVLAVYDLETREMTGEKKVFFDNPVLFSTGGGMGFSLGRAPLIGGSAGYYSSYFKVTDLAGNSFLSDPYTYILADSYKDFYLGVIFPVFRDPETGAVEPLGDGDIRIMYNGIDVTASVCPDLDPADVVTYNAGKTLGTVQVGIDLGGDFEAGTLETYFAVCPDTESFMAACVELLNGQYACDPQKYGQNKHSFGDCDSYELLEHIRVVENVKYYYELGLDMQRDEDLRALNDAYALLIEEFDAGLTSGDMELLSPFSTYGYAGGLTFTTEKAAPAGNAAYQNVTAGMGKVRSYHVGLSKPAAGGGTTPAVKTVSKEPAAVKLTLSGLSKSDIDNLRVYYMENGSATPQLIPRENSDNYSKDHITLVENRGEPYLVISTFQALNDCYFVLCVPSSGGSSGGGSSGSTTTPGAANTTSTTVKTTTTNATTSGTTASATVSSPALNSTVNSAVTEAAQKGTAPVVEVKVNTSADADSLEVTLPADALETLAKANKSSLVITSGIAEVSLDHTALSALVNEATGSTIIFEAAPVEVTTLSTAQKEAVGEAEVVNLSLLSDGAAIHNYSGGNITVTLPYTLKSGETASDIVVYYLDDGGSLTPCSTSYSNGKVTFVTTHLSKYVIGTKALGPVPAFADVPADAYYADAVAWAVRDGVAKGTDDTHFSPMSGCTRAQFVTFLWRASGSPEPAGSANPFSDVSGDTHADYYKAILWAVEQSVTTGTGDGTTFSPDAVVARAQAVTFMYRYAQKNGFAGGTGVATFDDVSNEGALAPYYNAVGWAVANGITNGNSTTENTFGPMDDCDRGMMITFLYRLFA